MNRVTVQLNRVLCSDCFHLSYMMLQTNFQFAAGFFYIGELNVRTMLRGD